MTTHGVERGQSGILGGQRWFVFLLALVAAMASFAGCSDDSSSGSVPTIVTTAPTVTVEATTTTEPAAPTTTEVEPSAPTEATATSEPESIEALIADRVRAFFEAREDANAGPTPNPSDPGLAEVAVGEALTSTIAETQKRLDDGRAIRAGEQGLAAIGVGAVQVSGDTASVGVCSIDDGVIYNVATDEVINDDVVTHNYVIDLALDEGTWRVARVARLQQWEGVAGCALALQDFPH